MILMYRSKTPKSLVIAVTTGALLATGILTGAAPATALAHSQNPTGTQTASHPVPLSHLDQSGEVPQAELADADFPYCNARYAYYRSGNPISYVPLFESVSRDTARCVLEEGSTGQGVTTLQISLDQCYGQGLDEDGVFGDATYRALLAVQSAVGVTIDGVYGPETGRAMLHGGESCQHVDSALFDQ